jgi:excisionase family DNA binding protein
MATVLSVEEAAKLVGMKPQALRGKARSGLIPAAKPGKEWVFIKEDLIEYIRGLYLFGKKDISEDKSWQQEVRNSINVEIAGFGGTGSRIQELRDKNEEARRLAIGK